jgi:archaellum biogenesis ATPase FlaH
MYESIQNSWRTRPRLQTSLKRLANAFRRRWNGRKPKRNARQTLKLEISMLNNGREFSNIRMRSDISWTVRFSDCFSVLSGHGMLNICSEEATSAVLSWINGIMTTDDFNKAARDRQRGTCKWILARTAFKNWKDGISAPSVLWINAPPGYGKTFLSAKIVESMRLEDDPVAYFFCGNNLNAQYTEKSIVTSWIMQLVSQKRATLSEVEDMRRGKEKRSPSIDELWELLQRVVARTGRCFLVLDGVDEIIGRTDILSHVLELASSLCPGRFLIVSRDEADIRASLMTSVINRQLQCSVEYKITEKDVTDDIKSFANTVVFELQTSMELDGEGEDALLLTTIRDALLSKSGGMFLWVHLVRDALKACQTSEEVEETLASLPEGLHAIYKRILTRIECLPNLQKQRAIEIFRWVLFARRPLTVQELNEALAVREGDRCLNRKRLMKSPHKGILALCSPFVEIRRLSAFSNTSQNSSSSDHLDYDHVVIAHFSVKEFLLSTVFRMEAVIKPFADKEESHLQLAVNGITCLSFPPLETTLTEYIESVLGKADIHYTTAGVIDSLVSNSEMRLLAYYIQEAPCHLLCAGDKAAALIKKTIVPILTSQLVSCVCFYVSFQRHCFPKAEGFPELLDSKSPHFPG